MHHGLNNLLPSHQTWQTWLKPLCSLKIRSSLMVVCLILVVTVCGMALSTRAISTALYQSEAVRVREWANSLAASASNAVKTQDRVVLTKTVNTLLCTGNVSHVVFADVDGQLLARGEYHPGTLPEVGWDHAEILSRHNLNRPRIIRRDSEAVLFEVTVPVRVDSLVDADAASAQVVGYLQLAIDSSSVQARIQQISRQLRQAGILLLLFVIPCSLLFTRQVVSPIQELANVARSISNGVMDARAGIRSRNEIGQLAQAFNIMADRVITSQMDLLRLNTELEDRVQQRTRELEELASRDPLTGLHNRRYFGEVIAREFAGAERYDADMSVLMFDLDHFKQINDQFGHGTGDEVLLILAQSVTGELRSSDIGARFGGDEFIILLPQTSSEAAAILAKRIGDRFTKNAAAQFPEVPTTLSMGIASLRRTRASSAEALIRRADAALYAAKQAGRDCAVEATPAEISA